MARSCAGVGSAIVTIITVLSVSTLGKLAGGEDASEIERLGYRYFALIIAVLFFIFITITCLSIKEKSSVNMETATVKEMFRALFRNDQAMTMVVAGTSILQSYERRYVIPDFSCQTERDSFRFCSFRLSGKYEI